MKKLYWKTEQRLVRDLIPYEKNPRAMTEEEVRQLTASIEKFGLVEIPVVDTDNRIIAGHQRLTIMRALHRDDEYIEVRVPNRKLTEGEFDEYLVRSNKNTGHWDFDKLANGFVVEELLEWGFNASELGMGAVDPLEGEMAELRFTFSKNELDEVNQRFKVIQEMNGMETKEAVLLYLLERAI